MITAKKALQVQKISFLLLTQDELIYEVFWGHNIDAPKFRSNIKWPILIFHLTLVTSFLTFTYIAMGLSFILTKLDFSKHSTFYPVLDLFIHFDVIFLLTSYPYNIKRSSKQHFTSNGILLSLISEHATDWPKKSVKYKNFYHSVSLL